MKKILLVCSLVCAVIALCATSEVKAQGAFGDGFTSQEQQVMDLKKIQIRLTMLRRVVVNLGCVPPGHEDPTVIRIDTIIEELEGIIEDIEQSAPPKRGLRWPQTTPRRFR